ncbi:hypothetical protein CALVIDRAFT_563695 [Calocera viscosa TUFC12733]|uniref:Zn(2)-C6 fungal-type domain-containing protein n=1 Tax=Calocera viscosa (strain TUFC12733) TaxID=1330018 RepID=A0A167ME35_CALVF|nr:hypothetical protein CALVIDRAFT_563695 [Calocera viscosa TUFC12733]
MALPALSISASPEPEELVHRLQEGIDLEEWDGGIVADSFKVNQVVPHDQDKAARTAMRELLKQMPADNKELAEWSANVSSMKIWRAQVVKLVKEKPFALAHVDGTRVHYFSPRMQLVWQGAMLEKRSLPQNWVVEMAAVDTPSDRFDWSHNKTWSYVSNRKMKIRALLPPLSDNDGESEVDMLEPSPRSPVKAPPKARKAVKSTAVKPSPVAVKKGAKPIVQPKARPLRTSLQAVVLDHPRYESPYAIKHGTNTSAEEPLEGDLIIAKALPKVKKIVRDAEGFRAAKNMNGTIWKVRAWDGVTCERCEEKKILCESRQPNKACLECNLRHATCSMASATDGRRNQKWATTPQVKEEFKTTAMQRSVAVVDAVVNGGLDLRISQEFFEMCRTTASAAHYISRNAEGLRVLMMEQDANMRTLMEAIKNGDNEMSLLVSAKNVRNPLQDDSFTGRRIFLDSSAVDWRDVPFDEDDLLGVGAGTVDSTSVVDIADNGSVTTASRKRKAKTPPIGTRESKRLKKQEPDVVPEPEPRKVHSSTVKALEKITEPTVIDEKALLDSTFGPTTPAESTASEANELDTYVPPAEEPEDEEEAMEAEDVDAGGEPVISQEL